MWHEARRRERATQKLFSDHKKRAEKRREEDRVDPSGLLQVNGVKSKINIDPNTHKQATNSMVVWQGDQKTTIDRFDVRATLSSLPLEDRVPDRHEEGGDNERRRKPSVLDLGENEFMRKILNFERYCLVMQNDINKVPEKTRLNLVERKNDILSDAKMRKLKNNWFGTSGETSISDDYATSDNRHPNSRSQGASIAYEYGVTNTNVDTESANLTNSAIVCDLDDCETELDLDCVDRIESDASNINDSINRYGLNCDEFNLLVESASQTTKEIIQKLKQVREEARQRCEANRSPDVIKQQDYYGPSLPPDMQKRENNIKSAKLPAEHNSQQCKVASRESEAQITTHDNDTSRVDVTLAANSDQGSASQQAKDIINTSNRPALKSPRQSDNLEESSRRKSSSVINSTSSSNDTKPANVMDTSLSSTQRPGQIQINLRTEDKLVGSANQPEIVEDKPHRARRASTPLAYKRYCRSSRSMSRERISSNRYRSSSSSSSSSFTSSRSTTSSRSDSSSGNYSRSRSRRRRVRSKSRSRSRSRLRSRSPRYRRPRRSRHRYRRKDRR